MSSPVVLSTLKPIGIIGSGSVGETLAGGFLKHGFSVIRSSRDPSKLKEWCAKVGSNASAASSQETVAKSDIIVLAVKGSAALSVVKELGKSLAGKIVIDATNPIEDAPPDHGVLRYSTHNSKSLMEMLQETSPDAKFVKAFSCTGSRTMVNPVLPGGVIPTMFICGKDDLAKKVVTEILTLFGWEADDMGGVEAARAIEPLAMLWCIYGFKGNSWTHAFKMIKPH